MITEETTDEKIKKDGILEFGKTIEMEDRRKKKMLSNIVREKRKEMKIKRDNIKLKRKQADNNSYELTEQQVQPAPTPVIIYKKEEQVQPAPSPNR